MSPIPEIERDEELIAACLAGDLDRFGALVRRHERKVFNVVLRLVGNREDAADLTQEAFLAAFSRLRSYGGRSSVSTWLCAIAVNRTRDLLRRRRLAPIAAETVEAVDPGASPEGAAAARQVHDRVRQALLGLPDHYREVLVLKHVEGYDYPAMSEILGLSVANLKVRAFRARMLFKALYAEASRAPA